MTGFYSVHHLEQWRFLEETWRRVVGDGTEMLSDDCTDQGTRKKVCTTSANEYIFISKIRNRLCLTPILLLQIR